MSFDFIKKLPTPDEIRAEFPEKVIKESYTSPTRKKNLIF